MLGGYVYIFFLIWRIITLQYCDSASAVKNVVAQQGRILLQCRRCRRPRVWSLGGEDPLEKGMVTHSTILACRIPQTEEPGRLQSVGSQRVKHDRSDWACIYALCWFLPYNNMNQPSVYICPLPLKPPSHLPPHPTSLGWMGPSWEG